MNSKVRDNLNSLKERDIYSLGLFCLYKLIGTAEYSSLSELVYVLDKKNLLNLCEYFGGQTITIPTVDELENLIYALLLYQYVKIEHKEYDEAIQLIQYRGRNLRAIKNNYKKLTEVLENYSFQTRPGIDDNY